LAQAVVFLNTKQTDHKQDDINPGPFLKEKKPLL